MRRAALALAVTLALGLGGAPAPLLGGAAAPAMAASSGSYLLTLFGSAPSGGRLVALYAVPVRFTGAIEVDFHGDSAAGCAARGVCGTSGAVSWTPPPTGELSLIEYRVRGRTFYTGTVVIDSFSTSGALAGGTTNARVSGAGAACADAVGGSGESFKLGVSSGRVGLDLAAATPSILRTRCGGPLAGDLPVALTRLTIPLRSVLAGRISVTTPASLSFARAGFAGQVSSALSLSVGVPRRLSLPSVPRTRRQAAIAGVSVHYALGIRGTAVERFTGASDPAVCGSLGACGVAGTAELRTDVVHGTADLFAGTTTGGSRPAADFLTALGLSRSGNPRRLTVFGGGAWSSGGTGSVTVRQGGSRCVDSVPLGAGTLDIARQRGRFVIGYLPESNDSVDLAGLPGRCPGPISGPAALEGFLPISAFARRRIAVRLTRPSSFTDDGYGVTVTPSVTVTLRRLRITTEPLTTGAGGSSSSSSSSSSSTGSSSGSFTGTFFGP